MAQTDNLFLLIKTMSKSEKRSFKLMAAKYNNNKEYINLFDTIDKQEEYDEEIIKKRFKNKKFINQLSVAKNYLFTTIVDSLYESANYDTIRFKLNELIKQIEVIKDRGLNELCIKYIEKAKRYAIQTLSFQEMLKLNRIEYDLGLKNILDVDIHEINKNYATTIKNYSNFLDYDYLSRLNYCYNILHIKSEDPLNAETAYLLNDENLALTFRAKEQLYGIWVYNYLKTSDYEKIYEIYQKIVYNLKAQYGEMVKEIPSNYCIKLNNLITASIKVRKFDAVQEHLKELDEISNLKISTELKYKIKGFYYCNSINYYYEIGNYTKAIEIFDEFLENIRSLKKYIKRPFIVWAYIIVVQLYFKTGDYKKSLKYINVILDLKSEIAKPNYLLSRLINLVLHYELGDFEYVDAGIDSLRKQFNSEDSVFELLIISTLRKLINVFDVSEKKEIFKQLNAKLSELKGRPSELPKLDFFDFNIWVQKYLKA